ncbi:MULTISPECIES: hypothetical protein [unclassified Nitratiruptor]|uniref:hypothetical protein n=1 Tax=unclassified Nitratiruptor TaxID=2624044 RepID=UPI00191557DD|nr:MULTISPECIES: hypothetical protein [unclassified Nitratiruptor]BCD60484.1 hypothetical protein NitYY0810_C1251 [Nitratiruptor sp. YY08-10]BCD64027.1 hypothetical protein NitYY0814_C0870 [Nitratiruptor sp. YY08-14]
MKNRELDRYEQALEEAAKELKKCQQEKQTTSCLACKEIIGCKIRNRYVQAVYESMNKGKGGGFEF